MRRRRSRLKDYGPPFERLLQEDADEALRDALARQVLHQSINHETWPPADPELFCNACMLVNLHVRKARGEVFRQEQGR